MKDCTGLVSMPPASPLPFAAIANRRSNARPVSAAVHAGHRCNTIDP